MSNREAITPGEAKRSLHALGVMSGRVTDPADRGKTGERRFIIEYVDAQGREYVKETLSAIDPVADNYTVWTKITGLYKPQGYEVTAITEILHGCEGSDIEAMRAVNPSNVLKHIRVIYLKSQKRGSKRR